MEEEEEEKVEDEEMGPPLALQTSLHVNLVLSDNRAVLIAQSSTSLHDFMHVMCA